MRGTRLSPCYAEPAMLSGGVTGVAGRLLYADDGSMRLRRIDDHHQCDACGGHRSATRSEHRSGQPRSVPVASQHRTDSPGDGLASTGRRAGRPWRPGVRPDPRAFPPGSPGWSDAGLWAGVVTVTLDDAPSSVAANGIDPDLLVVHQQDIQAVVNALWSGGAEAMTIQDQRVISTTAVKCVGNTVLHGIPYSPPYVITAIGDQARLRAALANLSRSRSSAIWSPTDWSFAKSPSRRSPFRDMKARSSCMPTGTPVSASPPTAVHRRRRMTTCLP